MIDRLCKIFIILLYWNWSEKQTYQIAYHSLKQITITLDALHNEHGQMYSWFIWKATNQKNSFENDESIKKFKKRMFLKTVYPISFENVRKITNCVYPL